jgi:hypothetical protein
MMEKMCNIHHFIRYNYSLVIIRSTKEKEIHTVFLLKGVIKTLPALLLAQSGSFSSYLLQHLAMKT